MIQSTIFISYSHKDKKEKDALVAHLGVLASGGQVDVWTDDRIGAGDDWKKEISGAIYRAKVAILLITADYLEPDTTQQDEVSSLLKRRQNDGLIIFPIIAKACAWETIDWLRQMSVRPKSRQPVWRDQGAHVDDDLADIANEVKLVIEEKFALSEDGDIIAEDQDLHPPLSEFDPAFLGTLEAPGGAVKMRDRFYIEREADAQLKREIVKWGTTTVIRAPRQTGKTSLLIRGIHHAREQGFNVVFFDFQSIGRDQLVSLDTFLKELAWSICDELHLDQDAVEQAWAGERSVSVKIRHFMEEHVLPLFDEPIALAMDEADSLLQTDFYKDFFSLLRSWHNRRAWDKIWEKLNMVLVISTEPFLLIDNPHLSPFNVGLNLELKDFDEDQLRRLNGQYESLVPDNDLPELMHLLNGHPYLTRLALYRVATKSLSWTDLIQHAPTDEGPFGDHLWHQYRTIQDKPELKSALKQIIRTGHCSDEMAFFRLLRAGLVKGRGDVYACRCELYKLYFEYKLF